MSEPCQRPAVVDPHWSFGCSVAIFLVSSKWYMINFRSHFINWKKRLKRKAAVQRVCHSCDKNLKYDMHHRPTGTSIRRVNVATNDNYDIGLITKLETVVLHPSWCCMRAICFFPIDWSERLSIAFRMAHWMICPFLKFNEHPTWFTITIEPFKRQNFEKSKLVRLKVARRRSLQIQLHFCSVYWHFDCVS